MSNYLTSPRASKSMPKGIPYIIGNELAERFSFYGMKCILMVFMTKYLMDSSGQVDLMTDKEAREQDKARIAELKKQQIENPPINE